MISSVIAGPCMSERLTTHRNSRSNASRSGGGPKVRSVFPDRRHLLVLADTGGSNGATCRAWKHGIQHKLCNEHGLHVTVAHYPPGASKWNPIEHRLFSEISKNWAGRPLDSYETVLNFIRTTKTKTGLKVNARLVNKQYAKGIKISDPAMTVLNFKRPTSLPKWNYTLRPSKNGK